jgi:hypothetical protein
MIVSYGKCTLCAGRGFKGRHPCFLCDGYGLIEHPSFEDLLRNIARADSVDEGGTLEKRLFDQIHKSGAKRWKWAWVQANRFAAEMARQSGLNPAVHRYALSKMVWKWMETGA